MEGINTDLQSQMNLLFEIIKQNEILYSALVKAQSIGVKDYYFGAGCITQTVWNYQVGNDLCYGISDMDIIYYDGNDLSYEAENNMIEKIAYTLNPCCFKLDIKNQARVHLWYKNRFGYDISPYLSVEDAINSWPTTATSIGIRLENNSLITYAPYGLNDLFGLVLRANKMKITKEIYLQKVDKWKNKWIELSVIPW